MITRIQQLHPLVDLITISLSICKEHSHKLAHYFSHKETLNYEDHSSLLSKTLFLSCFCSYLVVCCECLLMVLFIGETSQSCLTCMKTLVICLYAKHQVSLPMCAQQHILLIHYTMYTLCTLVLVIACNLPFCQMYVGHVAMVGPRRTSSSQPR